jgi:hypothetical protein
MANYSNKGPRMVDLDTYIAAGINPKTGLPLKAGPKGPERPDLKDGIKKQLRILDEQNAIHRYVWYNLPDGLTGELIERILYYKGQGMLFFDDVLNKFFFLPFALSAEDGTGIDVYGRFTSVKPLPFNGSTSMKKDNGKQYDGFLGRIQRDVAYEYDEPDIKNLSTKCVLLHDYCKQISQTTLPRATINDCVLDIMAECFPMMRTNLINSSGVSGLRVNDDTEDAEVQRASAAVYKAAMEGDKWVSIKGAIDFQELSNGTGTVKAEEYLLAMQALDNYRLSLYGLQNGGLFQKKSHMLEAEQNMNAGNTSLALQDGLNIRQEFCNMANWTLGTLMSCEINENVINMDRNMDGKLDDDSSEVKAVQNTIETMGGEE